MPSRIHSIPKRYLNDTDIHNDSTKEIQTFESLLIILIGVNSNYFMISNSIANRIIYHLKGICRVDRAENISVNVIKYSAVSPIQNFIHFICFFHGIQFNNGLHDFFFSFDY